MNAEVPCALTRVAAIVLVAAFSMSATGCGLETSCSQELQVPTFWVDLESIDGTIPSDLAIVLRIDGVPGASTWTPLEVADSRCAQQGPAHVLCGFGSPGDGAGNYRASGAGYVTVDEAIDSDCAGSKGRYSFVLGHE